MTKRGPVDLALRRVHAHLVALLGGGAILTSVSQAALDRKRLSFLDLETVIISGAVRTARAADGVALDGPCTLCTVRGATVDGRRVGLLIEVQEHEAVIIGID